MSASQQHLLHTPKHLAHIKLDQRSQSRRSATPNGRLPSQSGRLMPSIESDWNIETDPRLAIFKTLYQKSAARLASLFDGNSDDDEEEQAQRSSQEETRTEDNITDSQIVGNRFANSATLKRKARAIDEDDYDDDDSDGEDVTEALNASPLKTRSTLPVPNATVSSISMSRGLSQTSTPGSIRGSTLASKTTEAARKRLEEERRAVEDDAKRTFHTLYYTLENDKDAMLEQNKLEESERKVDAELGTNGGSANGAINGNGHGILSQTNLGASSLTLKNLIKRIDDQRDNVRASDSELRTLMSEVRKNRSKWASEEKVGQEELYEACDKVLSELKGQTEHSTHFLNKVNKKDAPDYTNIIKHPMDLGTMTKKLKNYNYKSKKEFVEDAMLIWANCLKYNANPDHYMRKHALFMRKETEKLVPLIPEIIIRDRAEVEAEERRLQRGTELEGEEDSDDEPIISSRGRKAPGKKSKKGTTARKAPAGAEEDEDPTAAATQQPNGVHSKEDGSRADSETGLDGSQTPPLGAIVPTSVNGILAHGAAGTQGDVMDVDADCMLNGISSTLPGANEEPEYEDLEYKTWKQVTKKDRAIVTAERHRLFRGDRIDPDAPALLRNKAGMRSWLRKQRQAASDSSNPQDNEEPGVVDKSTGASGNETLAEGMEDEDERVLPDYYDPLSAIPDVSRRLRWIEDSDGSLVGPTANLRQLPQGMFISPSSALSKKIDWNTLQIQETRRLTSKIGIVKQMALQSQIYQGQFQRTELIPLVEQDVEPHVASDDGPVMAPQVCRAALQRSAAKLLVHAGFEEFQPSALDAFTDLASEYFTKVAKTLAQYAEASKVPVRVAGTPNAVMWKQRFTVEESILHSLQENGVDLEALDSYVSEDIERAGARLATSQDRMKAHYADLLRPALTNAGPDGSGAFEDDSEQFITGDFAEELGEDFLGLKELGLSGLFGDLSMNLPLHLMQKKLYNAGQANNQIPGSSNTPYNIPPPPPYTPITLESIDNQIGLVRDFFLAKLHANDNKPLVEDEELPIKQRLPKPRLPPSGKISSPRKRPVKEPGPGKGHPRKKIKFDELGGNVGAVGLATGEASAAGDPTKVSHNDGVEKVNGVSMSREPSKNDLSVDTTPVSKPLTNGVLSASNKSHSSTENTSIAAKGDLKVTHSMNAETGSLPSPESLEAT